MIQVKFGILYSLELSHEYYVDGVESSLSIVPTAACSETLRNYGLLLRKTEKGVVILYEMDPDDDSPIRPIEEDTRFSFIIFYKSVYHETYSDLPMSRGQRQVYYMDNLTDNKVGDTLHLTDDTSLGSDELVEIYPQRFEYEHTLELTSMTVSVDDMDGTEVFTKTLTGEVGDTIPVSIDLSKYPTGRYDLKLGGMTTSKLYLDSEKASQKIFGIIDIYKNSNVPATYEFANADGDVTERTYTLNIGRRESKWKYYVVLDRNTTNPGYKIEYGDKTDTEVPYPAAVTFNSEAPESYLTDKFGAGKILLFESNINIPHYEVPKSAINLTKPKVGLAIANADPETEPFLKNLPNASNDAILKQVEGDTTTVYSEIFIYI